MELLLKPHCTYRALCGLVFTVNEGPAGVYSEGVPSGDLVHKWRSNGSSLIAPAYNLVKEITYVARKGTLLIEVEISNGNSKTISITP